MISLIDIRLFPCKYCHRYRIILTYIFQQIFYYVSYFNKICRRMQKMDQAWMYDLARIDPVYIENVRHFVEEAMRHANI
jgi:hypothetical protein